jgi:hypothetical protein
MAAFTGSYNHDWWKGSILIPRDRTWQNLCGYKFVRLRETLSLSKVKPGADLTELGMLLAFTDPL